MTTEPVAFQPLDPAYLTVERIAGWIFTCIVLAAGLVGLCIAFFSFGPTHIGFAITTAVYLLVGGLLVWFTHFFPAKKLARYRWRLTDAGLEIHRGVWWRSEISIPRARVQHTDVQQGPLLRKYDIAKLIIHTAGTENASIELEGLKFATAQRLRDALVENRGTVDGV
jgi:uncharacterized protein